MLFLFLSQIPNLYLRFVFGGESAIRPDSLQRAGALGLLHQLLTMDVEDAEGLEEGAEDEGNTRGKGQCGRSTKTSWSRMSAVQCE